MASPRGKHQSREAAQVGGAAVKGALYCLVAGVAWGAQFPIAGSVLKLIDPFYFTLLRYLAVSLILVTLLIIAEGTKALSFEGKAKWVWLFGSMAYRLQLLRVPRPEDRGSLGRRAGLDHDGAHADDLGAGHVGLQEDHAQ